MRYWGSEHQHVKCHYDLGQGDYYALHFVRVFLPDPRHPPLFYCMPVRFHIFGCAFPLSHALQVVLL
jgi:hypothetical protein